jgi:hypothetical protein
MNYGEPLHESQLAYCLPMIEFSMFESIFNWNNLDVLKALFYLLL